MHLPTAMVARRFEPVKSVDHLIWHHRLAHLNFGALTQLGKKQIVIGFSAKDPDSIVLCEDCPFGKQHHDPFYISEFRADHPLHIVYIDLLGPYESSLGGSKYAFPIFDGQSGYLSIYFISSKAAEIVFAEFKAWHVWAELQTGNG